MGGKKQTTTTDQTQQTALDVNQSQQAQQFLSQFAQQFLTQQQQQSMQQQQQQTGRTLTQEQLAQQQRQQTQQQTQQQQQQQAVTGVDAASQAFIDQMRQQALAGAGGITGAQFAPSVGAINTLTGQLSNPFTEQVIQANAADFDRAREAAATASRQESTLRGAFGGDRQALTQGARVGEIDVAQAQQQAQLRNLGFQNAQQQAVALAQQQALAPAQAAAFQQQLLAGGLGPTGTTQTTTGQQTGQQTGQLTGQTTQQQQAQQQQQMQNVLSQLSNLFGTQSGTQSGTQFGTQQSQQDLSQRGTQNLQSTQTQQSGGFGFGDILGGVLSLAGAGFNPLSALGAIGGLFGGGGGGQAGATGPAPQVAPISMPQLQTVRLNR